MESPLEDLEFPVGEPLLEHLVAAELVAPDSGGDVAPECLPVEINVERRVTQGGRTSDIASRSSGV